MPHHNQDTTPTANPKTPHPLSILGSVAALGLALYPVWASQRPRRTAAVADAEKTTTDVTFADVAGVDEAKAELAEVVEFLKDPQRFTAIGARMPRGVLLTGAPGTGKTLLARAVAGEADVPFFSMAGSAFVELYVGVGASRVRGLFAKARRAAPCIVFIDEIDAVGGARDAGPAGNSEREQTLNELLIAMDGFTPNAGIVILAATNRPDMLDPALLRPGRFDRRVSLPIPDRAGRAAVLALHARSVRMEASVDLYRVAAQTSGMSPADLANLVNEAAIHAARQRRKKVTAADLDAALMRVIAGPEMRSRVVSPEVKRVIAFHEAGHAVAMRSLPHCDPVTRVQAIARGDALGLTVAAPTDDAYLLHEEALFDRLTGLMAGRAAEKVVFGRVTTGAQRDIEQANAVARRMVVDYGMSPLGHIAPGGALSWASGRETASQELASRIDGAVSTLVEAAYERALQIVTERLAAVTALAERLCEVETVEQADLDALIGPPASA